jgi:hypothetical protein
MFGMSPHAEIKNLEKQFRTTHSVLARKRRTGIILSGLTTIFGLSACFILVENHFYLSPAEKAVFWLLILSSGAAVVWLANRYFRIPGFTSFYRTTADRIGLAGIRHVLDLYRSRDQKPAGLLDAAIAQNIERLSNQGTDEKLADFKRKHPVTRFLKHAAGLAFVATLLFLSAIALYGDAFHRSSTFWATYQRPIPFEFTVTPGDTMIEQGTLFQVAVRFHGETPERVRLGLRTQTEKQPRIQGMSLQEDGSFASRTTELFEDSEYYIDMDGYRTELNHVRVELLPRLRDLALTVHPPGYTKLESRTYTYPFNRIDAQKGSDIELQALRNKPLERIQLIAESSGDTLNIQPDSLISVRIRAESDERYHFEMNDRFGLANTNPFRFRIAVIEDQPPYVNILSPDARVHDFVTQTVPLLYEYEDDFGITSVRLHYRLHKAFVNVPVEGNVNLPVPGDNRGLAEYDWDVSAKELSAKDRLEYWIEITDNNEVDGYQTTRSATHSIEIPSLAARLFEQEVREEEIGDRLGEMEESYRRVQEEMERLRESIQTRPDDEWEHSRLIDEIREQRSELEQQLEDLKRNFDELTRDMEQQDLMSEETVERYRDLQNLLDEIDDPDILRLLEELQNNLSRMDQSQLREQLENIEFNEERYRERLERTIELFKSLRMDADLDRMSRLMEDLQQQEDALSRQDTFGEEDIARQEQIREQMQEISEQLQKLPEKSPLRRQDSIRDFNESMQQQMEQLDEQLMDNIRDMLEQMQDGDSDPSGIRQQQQDISHEMGRMSEQMAGMRQHMQQQALNINMEALRYILDHLLLLSEEQEDVARRTSDLTAGSPGFIEQARRQRNINGQFAAITDSLYRVSTEIPQFSNRINDRKRDIQRHMDRAVGYLIDRNRSQATAQERTALGGLNEIGTMVADLLDQLSQMDGGGEGQMSLQQMMEQMQGMSEDQQQLNQQIQDFINDLQGERLTRDHMERLEQMARQQNEIREQMQEMRRRGGRDGDRLMSDMERLAEEMERAINDLRGGSTDELMVERQHNILSRMLEIEESVHRRDEDEEQRLGETAEEYEARDIPEMTMEQLRERIRSGVEQTHYTRFRDEYRRLIERYFELIEEYLESNDPQSHR